MALPLDFYERKRMWELTLFLLSCALIGLLSRFEGRLYGLSEQLSGRGEFFATLVYFALINVYVILIIGLSVAVFRYGAKLVADRQKGKIGSRLTMRLIIALVGFAMAPTFLLSYVSTRIVTQSFNTWFSERARNTMQQTRDAGAMIYRQDQKRMESLSQMALSHIDLEVISDWGDSLPQIRPGRLTNFADNHGLSRIALYDLGGQVYWENRTLDPVVGEQDFVQESLVAFQESLSPLSVVNSRLQRDLVQGVTPITDTMSGRLLGVVLTEVQFEAQILKSIEQVIDEFSDLRPGAQLIRMGFVIPMMVIALFIVFSAIWMGFHVARSIIGPLEDLASATRQVAVGNYAVTLAEVHDDEIGEVVRAFNKMTQDLTVQRSLTQQTQRDLQQSNRELDRRRHAMEAVLQHITAGVVSLDAGLNVSSCNDAAAKMLAVHSSKLIGCGVDRLKGRGGEFIKEVVELMLHRDSLHQQIDVGQDSSMIVDATRVRENHVDMGLVIVFDDARERSKVDRIAAWKEVARRIAHEIKNPVTPIQLNAQRLLRRLDNKLNNDDQKVLQECLQAILAQVENLRGLVDEFSKFARLPRVKKDSNNFQKTLEEMIFLFKSSYPDVKMTQEGFENLSAIQVDCEQMKRAFFNIISNGVEAMGGRGRINVIVSQRNNKLRIEVLDDGPGIPDHLKKRVIEPYYSTKETGTGLGLAIVEQIVAEHHGEFRFENHDHQGTCVVVELPMENDSV
ncbi:MAG: ATP-binding protein [Oligoflexales bacterium]